MKIPTLLLTAFCALIHPLVATPDHAVDVTERILGSNPTGFAVLRTETDNLSSYYRHRVTTWLDETPKTSDGREKVKSTLLLDVTYSVDIDHTDRNTPPAADEEINSQDTSLTLASVLQCYPGEMQKSWTPEQLSKLEIHPVGGIHSNRGLELADATFIREKLFGGRQGEEPWKPVQAWEDDNAIYLRLSIGNDSPIESRTVCVSPNVTKQLRDQASAQPVYLITGKFDTLGEAMKAATALVAKAKAKKMKFYQFHPEIWSFEDGTLKTQYVIADEFSTERIETNSIPEIEKTLEIRLTPMSSKLFIEKFFVSN